MVTVKLVLNRTPTQTQKKTVCIRVTNNRIPHLYSAKCSIKLTKEEFANDKLKITKQAKEQAQRALNIANDIVAALGSDFSFSAFRKEYTLRLSGKKKDTSLFCPVAEDYINTQPIKYKTKRVYTSAVNWIKKFNPKLKTNEISSTDVEDFIAYVKKEHHRLNGKDLSENTLRIYLRSLRAIYNHSISQGVVTTPNPFAHIKGQPLGSVRRTTTALDEPDLAKLTTFESDEPIECFARDFFCLTIQLSGANLGDILSLKNSNIVNETIVFQRRKTQKSGLITTIPFTDGAKEILEKYGHLNAARPDDYILPYLSSCSEEKAIENKIHDINKRINKGLSSICRSLNIKKVTTYTARHTYAAFAQSEGLSAEQIQKFLGHTSSKTTQVYLGSLTKTIQEKNRNILDRMMQGA